MSLASDIDFLKSFGQVAAPAGLAIGVFLYIARDLIAKNVFPALTRERAYHVILALAFMAWTVALAGIASWTYVNISTQDPVKNDLLPNQAVVAQTILNDLSTRDFDAVYTQFSDHRKNELPPHKIAAAWDQVVAKLGPEIAP